MSFPDYFDRAGQPIDVDTYVRLLGEPGYRVVQQDDVLTPDGRMLYVSTVWLGFDHAPLGPPREIFETMIFVSGMAEEYCARYATEDEATHGHHRVLDQLHEGVQVSDLDRLPAWRGQ